MLSLRGILSWDLDESLGLVLHRQVINHVNPQNPRNQAKNPKLQFQLWALHLGFRFGGAVGFRLQDFGFRVSASTVNRIPQRLAHSLYVCMYIQTYMHKCIHTCIPTCMHALRYTHCVHKAWTNSGHSNPKHLHQGPKKHISISIL